MRKNLSTRTSAAPGFAPGFTLVELLAVVAIIAIIVSLLLIALPQVQRQSRSTLCLTNQRQLSVGFMMYYDDNAGRFMGVDTGIHPDWDWVNSGLPAFTGESLVHLERGAMWAYVGAVKDVYKSPFDPFPYPLESQMNAATAPTETRVRTYAFNSFISDGEGPQWNGPQNWQVNMLAKIPRPSDTILTTLEYDHRGYNMNGFGIDMSGNGIWIDKIAPWHPQHWNFSMVDGSVLSQRYQATSDQMEFFMTKQINNVAWPGPDYEWLRRRLAPGMF